VLHPAYPHPTLQPKLIRAAFHCVRVTSVNVTKEVTIAEVGSSSRSCRVRENCVIGGLAAVIQNPTRYSVRQRGP